MRLSSLLAMSLVVAPLTTIASQESPVLKRGDRVRVRAPSVSGGPFIGTLVALETDSLVVQGGTSTRRLALASIAHLDISRGRRSHTVMGAGIGFLVGAGVGTVWILSSYGGGGDCDPVGPCIALACAFLGGGGAVVGAVTGALIRTERWAEVPLGHLRLSLTPGTGRALTLTASLSL